MSTTSNVQPAGTILCAYCSGSTLVKTIADGNSGTRQESVLDSNLCRVILTDTPATAIDVNSKNLVIDISTFNGYIAGHTDITLTVMNDIYVYSTNVGIPAFTITGAAVGDNVTLVNNGYILGMAGNGIGGIGLYVKSSLKLVNNGYICGGPNTTTQSYYSIDHKDSIIPGGPAILCYKQNVVTYEVRGTIWGTPV